MRKIFFLLTVIFLFFNRLEAQHHTINGYVEDASTGERLIGCIVRDANNDKFVTTTNTFGFFSLKTNKSTIKLQIMYIGYKTFEQEFTLSSDTSITVELELENEIDKVVVTADRQNVQSTQMSKIDISISKVQKLPVIFGETDLLKSLQLMPGVQSGTEGSNGIYVRGGGPDQNLILLDGVPVYNVSHMFGFFSVFNTAAIKNVTLYKGGFPARFGGRLSSVVDVQMKDGNLKKLSGSVSVGIIASKFTIEGPIKKDKTSFIFSARRTYIDLLAKPFIAMFGTSTYNDPYSNNTYKDKNSGGYYFYDLNAKITHKLTDKDRLFLSFYAGQDIANYKYESIEEYNGTPSSENTKFQLAWGNIIAAARWNHTFKKNLFVNTTFTYSRFNFGVDFDNYYEETDSAEKYTETYNAAYSSGIDDLAMMVNFDYLPNVNHKIKFGLSGIYHHFRPGTVNFAFEISNPPAKYDSTFGSADLYASEFAAYAEDDITLTKWLKVNVGGRISSFMVRDTVYFHPEPRVAARILFTKNLSLKFSYAEMMQYLHFLTNNTVGLPIDLWMPATDITVPEQSWQAATGVSWLIKNKVTLSVEGFYKEMNNLIEFKEGESIFSKPSEGGMGEVWEQKVVQGEGLAYGAELFLQKNTGKFTGWIAYTLSWTTRTFAGINYGKTFPYKYDRRHDISIVGMYDFNENINMAMTWVYGSGTPVTLAEAEFLGPFGTTDVTYTINGRTTYSGYSFYGNRNNYRLPAYHRLDFSLNISKQKKRGKRTWSFSVYNAYNHINPFYTMLVNEDNKTYLQIVSIFPIMPSISYKFEW